MARLEHGDLSRFRAVFGSVVAAFACHENVRSDGRRGVDEIASRAADDGNFRYFARCVARDADEGRTERVFNAAGEFVLRDRSVERSYPADRRALFVENS